MHPGDRKSLKRSASSAADPARSGLQQLLQQTIYTTASSSLSPCNSVDGHTNKAGRKGDPRMHRSVAARLKDPKLSLFEALRQGGFEYPTDDDPLCTDADKVTLGQRKNQLSRRLRLARKNPDKFHFKEEEEEDSVHIKARFHPQFQPLIVPPRPATCVTAPAAAAPPAVSVAPPAGSILLNPFQTPPSGVAIASLQATALQAGMTLEQLALALQNKRNLAKVLQTAPSQDVALRLYQAECRGLYQKCLVLAGFEVTEDLLSDFCRSASRAEYEAWNDVSDDPPLEARMAAHIHSKKCGHKAILHHPANGNPHIDFVVGDKVECYEGHDHHGHAEPKLLDLNDVSGDEWNSDFRNDESLAGLFKDSRSGSI